MRLQFSLPLSKALSVYVAITVINEALQQRSGMAFSLLVGNFGNGDRCDDGVHTQFHDIAKGRVGQECYALSTLGFIWRLVSDVPFDRPGKAPTNLLLNL